MAIDWSVISKTHIDEASRQISQTNKPFSFKSGSIVLVFKDRKLPAKKVLRRAYEIAKGLDSNSKIKFSSGDAMVNMLTKMGYTVGRTKGEELVVATNV